MVYIIFTQYFINFLFYLSLIFFPKCYTNIVQYYIAIQYTPTYTHWDSGLPKYNHLNTLTNKILIHSPRYAMMIFCSLAIVLDTYRNKIV